MISGFKDSIFRLKSLDILKSHDSQNRIASFLDFLLEINRKINLVSRETSREDILRLAADCLIPLELGEALKGRFIDIGSGGGFPALILLLVETELSAVLYERTQKKARFLSEAIMRFNLKGEVFPNDFGAGALSLPNPEFDFATLKLVTPDKNILSGLSRLLRPGGRLYYYGDYGKAAPSVSSALFETYYHRYYLDNSEQLRTLTIFSRKV